MLGLVGGAFVLAGAEAAFVGRRRLSRLRRRVLRIVGFALGVSLLFALLFESAVPSCVPLFPLDVGCAMVLGTPLTFLGYALTLALLGKGSGVDHVVTVRTSGNLP
jgi:drug/metabolite transporter (DMT)-like permease